MRHRRCLGIFFILLTMTLLGLKPEKALGQGTRAKASPPYAAIVELEYKSPCAPDGRMSLAEFSFQVVFYPVTFEFDPEADPVLGHCKLTAAEAAGKVTRLVLNDVQEGDDRHKPWFTRGPTKTFAANIDIETEPSSQEGKARRVPPNKINLVFWTDFSQEPTEWGSKLGSNVLANIKLEFEAPFADLMNGKPRTIQLPYEGTFPEDKGAWKIEFRPETKNK